MEVKFGTETTLNCDYIMDLIGFPWHKCYFTKDAENDSYIVLPLGDWYIEQLEEEIEYEESLGYAACQTTINRMTCDLKLIRILKEEYGLKGQVLVYVGW